VKEENRFSLNFSIEGILQIFKIIDKKLTIFKESGDIFSLEMLQNHVIPKYEKIYLGLIDENFLQEYEEEKFQNTRALIAQMLKTYGLTEAFVLSRLHLREKHRNRSGAEVIRNLFQYEKIQLLKKKNVLSTRVDKLLEKHKILTFQFSETIQESEQMELLKLRSSVYENYVQMGKAILEMEEKIEELENKLEKKWYYEIFGTISKEDMLAIYGSSSINQPFA
jgi:hypothetical protein